MLPSPALCNASLLVAKQSGCPSSNWQDAAAPWILASRGERQLTFLNVGANKVWRPRLFPCTRLPRLTCRSHTPQGYNVAEFLQRFHSKVARPTTGQAWWRALLALDRKDLGNRRVQYGCGMCNACRARGPRSRHHVPVSVHAVEMVEPNVRALRLLFDAFAVPGRVHHVAVSNYTGEASYGHARSVGLEHLELNKASGNRVRVTTLDELASTHRIGSVDLLSVDAEGQDALILEGARGLLAARRVAVLEFEYIGRGFWRRDHPQRRRLPRVVDALHGWGFRCFWQGESGRLAPLSGRYWCDQFEFRARSNIVCSHLPRVLRAFHSLAGTSPEAD